ncbi:hypothetical protein [Rhodobacter ferrooxidans]|uniref:Uncharacterized protein n=1 Tax=Rhodobacter ferrooxidans TaxID=371731 RepID=C8RYC7_9RHOB|nr:hypothetical protein [Rhodobacter sp. SW2]EEW26115.1 hypothetical protein Rsw2DRAFT_0805 [Rhodobacter sp. SW2]
MRNEWIFDVLSDLRSFAQKNNLPALAAQVDMALNVARAEIADLQGHATGEADGQNSAPTCGRPH